MRGIISDARLAANRRNALRSTGPRTAAGKIRARANAVKHGLTGAGIALPREDAAAVEVRFLAIQGELEPTTVLGAYLAHRVALMTVRTQRAARHEAVALRRQVRQAGVKFDAARAKRAARLFARLAREPGARRALLMMPEGVDCLIRALIKLRSDLLRVEVIWDRESTRQAVLGVGQPSNEATTRRAYHLGRALEGDLAGLDPAEYGHLATPVERQAWAADEMDTLLDDEVARLREHRATLDHGAIADARIEAEELAVFDPSKEASLARRYEAASSRALHQSLREFRAVEVDADDDPLEPAWGDEPVEEPAEDDGEDEAPAAAVAPGTDEGSEAVRHNSISDNDLRRAVGSFDDRTVGAVTPADDDGDDDAPTPIVAPDEAAGTLRASPTSRF